MRSGRAALVPKRKTITKREARPLAPLQGRPLGQRITEIPSWLSQSEVEIEGRSRHLPFSKDDDLQDRLHWLQYRFSLAQGDIIENIIQRHLPAAPFSIKPTLRRRTVGQRSSSRG